MSEFFLSQFVIGFLFYSFPMFPMTVFEDFHFFHFICLFYFLPKILRVLLALVSTIPVPSFHSIELLDFFFAFLCLSIYISYPLYSVLLVFNWCLLYTLDLNIFNTDFYLLPSFLLFCFQTFPFPWILFSASLFLFFPFLSSFSLVFFLLSFTCSFFFSLYYNCPSWVTLIIPLLCNQLHSCFLLFCPHQNFPCDCFSTFPLCQAQFELAFKLNKGCLNIIARARMLLIKLIHMTYETIY